MQFIWDMPYNSPTSCGMWVMMLGKGAFIFLWRIWTGMGSIFSTCSKDDRAVT